MPSCEGLAALVSFGSRARGTSRRPIHRAGAFPERRPGYRNLVPTLQADPEDLTHTRRQIEGGYIAGHVEQLQAEERQDVADDDYD
jgi:hypothetical protein